MGKNLGAFLHKLADRLPGDLVQVERAITPANFEVTAILQHLGHRFVDESPKIVE